MTASEGGRVTVRGRWGTSPRRATQVCKRWSRSPGGRRRPVWSTPSRCSTASPSPALRTWRFGLRRVGVVFDGERFAEQRAAFVVAASVARAQEPGQCALGVGLAERGVDGGLPSVTGFPGLDQRVLDRVGEVAVRGGEPVSGATWSCVAYAPRPCADVAGWAPLRHNQPVSLYTRYRQRVGDGC